MKCPVCGKPLTESEYDKALGLWKDKQEHIKHLESEQKKLKDNQKKLEAERKKLKEQAKDFQKEKDAILKETRRTISEHTRKAAQQLKEQRTLIEKSFNQKLATEVKRGVEQGVEKQKREFKKQQAELTKTKNKMSQLENSLKVSARKYEQANEEIKKLKVQIEKGITPQIEGLLEEDNLLAKLKELFPKDKFEHPGKAGDIIQAVIEQGKEVGKIIYECKKVKTFNKNHVEQAKEARRVRQADFAVLVTNAFPSKKQYYFVDKTVFVISPVSLEPITYTLRESLVKMALLRITNEAKQKAVQRVYDYLSGSDYNNKVNDVASQLMDLGRVLKTEIDLHKRTWKKRYQVYRCLYTDIGSIDCKLKELVQDKLDRKSPLLLQGKAKFIEIDGLEG